jgi:hypothetical protein
MDLKNGSPQGLPFFWVRPVLKEAAGKALP